MRSKRRGDHEIVIAMVASLRLLRERRENKVHSGRVAILVAMALAGCARCSSKSVADAGPPPAPLLPEIEPALADPWKFARVIKAPEVSPPMKCAMRAPLVHAAVAETTRFIVDPRKPGALGVAEFIEGRLTKS